MGKGTGPCLALALPPLSDRRLAWLSRFAGGMAHERWAWGGPFCSKASRSAAEVTRNGWHYCRWTSQGPALVCECV